MSLTRRSLMITLVASAATGCAELSHVLESNGTAGSNTNNTSLLARAIKESLELGSTRASEMLSKVGGYSNSQLYRIPLPATVQPVATRLRQFGLGGQLDRIETLMNQAAEHAAGEANALFIDAVRAMTVTDAMTIVRGPDTAATQYFRNHTEAALRQRYSPIVKRHLEQIGFYRQYQQFLSAYKALPLSNKPNLDLEDHVLTQSLDGLFRQVGEEEKAIRRDPVGRGSSIIATVFAGR